MTGNNDIEDTIPLQKIFIESKKFWSSPSLSGNAECIRNNLRKSKISSRLICGAFSGTCECEIPLEILDCRLWLLVHFEVSDTPGKILLLRYLPHPKLFIIARKHGKHAL